MGELAIGVDGGDGDEVCVRLDVMTTDAASIVAKLHRKWAPKTVENFLAYVDSKFFDDTVFHRIISGFMVQGGGFALDFYGGNRFPKPDKRPSIKLEARADVPNKRGTLAMARTSDRDSATSQFFINLVDNHFLDHSTQNDGYTVFGEVLSGMNVVEDMGKVSTTTVNGYGDVPASPVILRSVSRVRCVD